MKLSKMLKRFRVDKPEKFHLEDVDPTDCCNLDFSKDEAKALVAGNIKQLTEHQEMLYAHDRWSVLMIFQAMDAAGKDGVIKHVLSGVNPQGVEVHSFKAPSPQELDHDFLWRAAQRLPERGRIGIFNRSYYEEVLVVRVHPEFLERQKLPREATTGDLWQERFKSIRAFERHLTRNGTKILKFHLRISKEEQRKRFLERLEEPGKRWKFSMGDVEERKHWDDYMAAYEAMIRETSTKEAPWYVVPADEKWFARLVVAAALDEALDDLRLAFPMVADSPELKRVRDALLAEGGKSMSQPKSANRRKSASKRQGKAQ
jgi:PPK2 family polyphosphate:nucleotide phosphotransferase